MPIGGGTAGIVDVSKGVTALNISQDQQPSPLVTGTANLGHTFIRSFIKRSTFQNYLNINLWLAQNLWLLHSVDIYFAEKIYVQGEAGYQRFMYVRRFTFIFEQKNGCILYISIILFLRSSYSTSYPAVCYFRSNGCSWNKCIIFTFKW